MTTPRKTTLGRATAAAILLLVTAVTSGCGRMMPTAPLTDHPAPPSSAAAPANLILPTEDGGSIGSIQSGDILPDGTPTGIPLGSPPGSGGGTGGLPGHGHGHGRGHKK